MSVSKTLRSRVTNGSKFYLDGNEKSAIGRRCRDIFAEVVEDLGGPDLLSESQRQLARRMATLSVECERLEGLVSTGDPLDLERYTSACRILTRIVQVLGVVRVPRDVTPHLHEYIEGRA